MPYFWVMYCSHPQQKLENQQHDTITNVYRKIPITNGNFSNQLYKKVIEVLRVRPCVINGKLPNQLYKKVIEVLRMLGPPM